MVEDHQLFTPLRVDVVWIVDIVDVNKNPACEGGKYFRHVVRRLRRSMATVDEQHIPVLERRKRVRWRVLDVLHPAGPPHYVLALSGGMPCSTCSRNASSHPALFRFVLPLPFPGARRVNAMATFRTIARFAPA